MAPLLFLALALAAKGSADASPALWCGSLLLLWLSALSIPIVRLPVTAVGVVVAALALWMVSTNFFVHPYNAAAQYQAAFLLGGYLYGRRAHAAAGPVLWTGLAFGVALGVWALWQLHAGAQRAQGPFVNPATFAAVINLLLLPALVLVIAGWRRPALMAMVGLLGIALVAATTRGAWLALAATTALAFLFLRRARLPVDRRAATLLAGLLALGIAIVWLWSQATLHELLTRAQTGARLELYRLALTGIEPSTLLFGAGYGAFYYLLETGRALVPSYAGAGVATYFVHNDYLQMLYELGLPGFGAFLFLIGAPVIQSWRKLPRLAEKDRLVAIAALAAILSMALHALVDFPFFVPLCVLMYGIALGVLDVKLSPSPPPAASPAGWARGLKAATITLATWILVMPAVAESAAAYAERQWRKGDAQRAAYWFEAARRIDARDWRYHWYAGQFWAAHAAAHADPVAAGQADLALAAAISANPREVRPLHSRLELHLRVPSVVAAPAEGDTLHAWADRAAKLAPGDPVIEAMRQRVLRYFPR